MNISDRRQQYLDKLNRVAEQHSQRRQTAFNKAIPIEERSTALGKYVGPLDDAEIEELESIIQNQSEDNKLRISAIKVFSNHTYESENIYDILFSLLEDITEVPKVRMAALILLQQDFVVGSLRPLRSQFMNVLRSLVDDKYKELRQKAVQILAHENDEYVQRRLLEGIERRSNKLIGISTAIQLLSSDIHVDNVDLLEEIVKNPPSRSAKKEAIRALASVPSSKELLRSILEDKDEHREVRQMSAVSYQAVAPEEFEKYAKQSVQDDDEYDDFRALSLTALSVFGDKKSLSEDQSFNEKVEGIHSETQTKVLKQAAGKYCKYLKK